MLLRNGILITFTMFVGCSPQPINNSISLTHSEMVENIYCGEGSIPLDWEESEYKHRCFTIQSSDELDFFVREFGHLEQYRSLNIMFINSNDLNVMSNMSDFTVGTIDIDMTELNNLNGIERLKEAGDVNIYNNDSLINVDGLSSLEEVALNINIQDNQNLINVDLPSLRQVGTADLQGGVIIRDNASLKSIEGFESLQKSGRVVIGNNPKLEKITGFSSLDDVFSFGVGIGDNPNLSELSGFGNVMSLENCNIMNNPKLSGCDVVAFCENAGAKNSLLFGNMDCSAD